MLPNSQRIQNSEIETRLMELPGHIAGEERLAAQCRAELEALRVAVEDAELNALLTASVDGKNEEARRLQRKQALQSNPDYRAAVTAVTQKESDIQQHDIKAKEYSKQFAALCAISELRAGAYLAQSNKATKQLQPA